MGNSLKQANLEPKTKNKLIEEIFTLTTRVGRWQSASCVSEVAHSDAT
jgi:hypothetical protein